MEKYPKKDQRYKLGIVRCLGKSNNDSIKIENTQINRKVFINIV